MTLSGFEIAIEYFFDKEEEVCVSLFGRRPDGILQAIEYRGDPEIMDALVNAAREFLEGIPIRDDEPAGDGNDVTSKRHDDDVVPDVKIAVNVTKEGKNTCVAAKLFTRRGDGELHLKKTTEFPDKQREASRMFAAAILVLKSRKGIANKPQWPIIRKFKVIKGGRDD